MVFTANKLRFDTGVIGHPMIILITTHLLRTFLRYFCTIASSAKVALTRDHILVHLQETPENLSQCHLDMDYYCQSSHNSIKLKVLIWVSSRQIYLAPIQAWNRF